MSKAVVESDAGARPAGVDPLVGKTLDGRFRIIERLGAGGMGTVYKAVQAPLDRIVALKVLNPNYDAKRDPGFQRRFFLEASVTSKLKHPNTITVIDYGKTDENIYYLAMEYVEGITLAQVLLAEGAVSWQRALHIGQQICRSLREAHRSGIIHRDLKPANVMICNEETDSDLVKVLDFGLVKSFQADGQGGMVTEGAELTQAGVFLGSPQYMAPEQARNVADPRSDIYSLGVVLFQMMMGKPPFWAEQSIDVIVKHMKEAPPSFHDVRPDLQIPPEVEALVMRCLEKEPGRRFQSMDEVLEGMRQLGSSGGLSGVYGNRSGQVTLPPGAPMGFPGTPPPMSQPQTGRHGLIPPTPSGPMKMPQSGAYKTPSGPRTGSGTFSQKPGTGPISQALEISVETSQPSGVLSAARPVPRSRKLLPIVIFAVTAVGGLGLVYALTRETTPITAPSKTAPTTASTTPPVTTTPPPTVTATEPAPPALVKFRVVSEPLGATVTMNGKEVGTTPFSLELLPGEGGNASATFSFALDGYEAQTVTAGGTGPEVLVQQRLRKETTGAQVAQPKSKPKEKPRENPKEKPKVSGYKDDPY